MATLAIQVKGRDSLPTLSKFSLPPSTDTSTNFTFQNSTSKYLSNTSLKTTQSFKTISANNMDTQTAIASPSLKRSVPGDATSPRPQKKLAFDLGTVGNGIVLEEEPYVQDAPLKATKKDEGSYAKRVKVPWYADDIRRKRSLASKVSGSWKNMPASGRKGMPNLTGFLCYRSSLLQVLLHQPKLVNWLQLYHKPENCISDDKNKCVSCTLHQLAKIYWQSSKTDLTDALKRVHILFRYHGWSSDVSSGQADPEEQASWLFNKMRSELPSSMSAYIDSLHYATMAATIKCNKCGRESRRDNQGERSLCVPIQPNLTNGTLSRYVQKYLVEPVEGYRCEKCGSKAPKIRTHKICHAPEILSIQLKRFNWDGKKLNVSIPIEATLDLDRHRSKGNEDRLQYELCGVIKHAGSASGGHYISVTKGPDGSWNEFDDARRSKSDITDARSQEKGHSPFTAYVLYYTRKA